MAINKLKLPRLPFNWDKQPDLFRRYWDQAMTQIETNFNALVDLPAIQDAVDAANAAAAAAQASADTAQTAADTATTAVDTSTAEQSLINSGVINESGPLGVTAGGLITIANHDRIYGNSVLNPTVSVNGQASISTGYVPFDAVYVYYNQSSRAGGTVTYLFSIDPSDAIQQNDVHCVGLVTVPPSSTTTGVYHRPTGLPPS